MPYDDTAVPVSKTQEAIKKLLASFQVTRTRFTSMPSGALLEFVRQVESDQLIPFRITISPKVRNRNATLRDWEQAERQVWRVAFFWLKSKLEAIEFGLVEFEEEFLPYMLLSGESGQDVTAAKVFFGRIAGRLELRDDPFGGMRPQLESGDDRE